MADKENLKRVTRSSKKRAALSMPEPSIPSTKRRVVLGEITNLTCIDLNIKPQVKNRKVLESAQVGIYEEVESEYEDLQFCSAYASSIYNYLFEKQKSYMPTPDYLEKVQPGMTAHMRAMLVDWLVDVSEEYKLVVDTLFNTVSYVDRFLSKYAVNKNKLQLMGVSAMLIASKYEEISPPHAEDFCYMTDNSYTKAEVLEMEGVVLKALKFEVGNPTIKTFLRRLTIIAQESYKRPNLKFEFLASYIAELCLLDYSCIGFLPSLIAASIIFLARFIIFPKRNPWCLRLEQQSGYKPSHLKSCVRVIHELTFSIKQSRLQAVIEKFNDHKFKFVANLVIPRSIPVAYFMDIF